MYIHFNFNLFCFFVCLVTYVHGLHNLREQQLFDIT